MNDAIFARLALLPSGWQENVRVRLKGNLIEAVTAKSAAQAGDTRVDYLVPGLSNLHSHAFQYADRRASRKGAAQVRKLILDLARGDVQFRTDAQP